MHYEICKYCQSTSRVQAKVLQNLRVQWQWAPDLSSALDLVTGHQCSHILIDGQRCRIWQALWEITPMGPQLPTQTAF